VEQGQAGDWIGGRRRVPAGPAAGALALLERLGLRLPITAEQVRRSQESRACDTTAARADLGWRPVAFEAGVARVYGAAGEAGRSP